MSKKIRVQLEKAEGDCSWLGKWLGWLIVAIVLGAWIAMATKAKGQGLLGGAGLLGAAGAQAVPGLRPVTIATNAPAASPGDSSGDTGPTVDLSDSIIVTTGGTSGGVGTQADPLSLTAALAGTGIMATTPNRVVLVRAGNYNAPSGGYPCRLKGTIASPWIIRGYPGELPVIIAPNGATTAARGIAVGTSPSTKASNVVFRFLRVRNPTVSKAAAGMTTTTSCGFRIEYAQEISIEHCVVDEHFASGIDLGSPYQGSLSVKYSLFFHNGGNDNKSHGFYVHSYSNSPTVLEGNVCINNGGYGLHFYDSHDPAFDATDPFAWNCHVNNGLIHRNIMRKSNTLQTGGPFTQSKGFSGNLDVGTNNVFIHNVASAVASGQKSGFELTRNSVVKSNYFQGGLVHIDKSATNNQFFYNTVVNATGANGMNLTVGLGAGQGAVGMTLNNNTYQLTGAGPWAYRLVSGSFATWQAALTPQETSSVSTGGITTNIFYFQSTIDTNVVHFAVMNETSLATVPVDFSDIWPPYGTITIRNAGNYDATPDFSNVPYTGQTFSIPMSTQVYPAALAGDMGTHTPSTKFYAGIAVRTPANPTLTQP